MSSSSEVLRAFLDHPDRSPGTLQLDELRGFLFAVVNAPEVIVPSEWIPAVFDDKEPKYASLDEARAIHEAMVEEYNAVNEGSLTAPDPLPPGCVIRADAMANLEQDAPLGRWARGFLAGHHWLEETWDEFLPDDDSELSEEFGVVVMVLGFFSSREMAEAFNGETRGADLEGMARTMLEALPTAVAEYVSIGRNLSDESGQAPEPIRRAGPKVGRNDLCPCGSGRKYKRCCGAPN